MSKVRHDCMTVMLLVLCVGAATAAGDNCPRTPASVLTDWIHLHLGDAALLANADNAPVKWVSKPGVLELHGSMIIRPITRDDLVAKGVAEADAAVQTARARDRLAPLTTDFVPIHNHIIISLPQGVDENQMSAFLMATGDYQYAEPNWMCYPVAIPNDAFYGSQYAHNLTNSEPAWDITTGSTSVIVAITDTGVVLSHQDLQPNLVSGANSASGSVVPQASGGQVNDINGHGTHCAGIAGARGNNGFGVAGSGWLNRIMPIRVSDLSSGSATSAAIQAGATWAAENGARIVSTSYSGVASSANQNVGFNLRTMYKTLWFWSVGNANTDLGGDAYPDLQIVSSTDTLDRKSWFSNYGQLVDIAAPGSDILATYVPNADSYVYLSGTSMACPYAAGAAGLILSVNTELTAAQVRDILLNSTDDLGTAGEDDMFGRGRVNLGRAVADAYRVSYPQLTLPFADDFESGSFANPRWVYRDTGTSVSTAGVNEPSGLRSANVNAMRRIESNAIRLNVSPANLHPEWASSSYFSSIGGNKIAGQVVINGENRAAVWNKTLAQWSDLHPPGYSASEARAASSMNQAGAVFLPSGSFRAALWSGTASSFVDLHPAGATNSWIEGAGGDQQVGYVFFGRVANASMWTGSAASWVNLHPAGASQSLAHGGDGTQQVGYAKVGAFWVACMWSGSAASWVNLNPPNVLSSRANCAHSGRQGGYVLSETGSRAGIWSGSAATWVELHPAQATGASEVLGMFGEYQVGTAVFGNGYVAGLWKGTASSWEDLAEQLPGSWENTHATGISSDGTYLYISGYGHNNTTGRSEAILWTRPLSPDRVLTYATQARGPAAGESLAVEYLNSTNQWMTLQTVTSTGAAESAFTPRTVAIPSGSTVRHPRFAVRFRSIGNSVGDNWYIDDVRIGLAGTFTCLADFNLDGAVDGSDVPAFLETWALGEALADLSVDGGVDGQDLFLFFERWQAGC